MAQKPLIVYAPQHFLQHMQQLGFKTFSDLWDEGYDTCEGPDRYKQIMKIVKNVANMSASEQLELYQHSRQICSHNKQHLIALSLQRVSR